MMSSLSPTNGAQDLHENLLCIGDEAGLSNQNEVNGTEQLHTLLLRTHCLALILWGVWRVKQ